jgi:GATA zinc finger
LSNIEAFPPLDTSLTFGPTTVSAASVSLEALEAVVKELETEEVEEWETEEVRVPTKRRSQVLRRPRQVFSNTPILLAGEGRNEKQPSVRRCTHCLVDETPQWRQGPAGPGTLCNACGVRYKSGRLYDEYRPANSPTFSPGKHSNFHRKVVEMRGGKQTDGGMILSTKVGRRSRLSESEHGGEGHDGGRYLNL